MEGERGGGGGAGKMSHAIGVIYPLDEEERMQRQTHTARIFPIDKGGGGGGVGRAETETYNRRP